MSEPVGSGYSEKEYDKRKRARDSVLQNAIKNGANPEKARELVDRVTRETDNKNRSKGK